MPPMPALVVEKVSWGLLVAVDDILFVARGLKTTFSYERTINIK